jgi:peptidoglycan/xylan/chitin deacetylase (PgdA/CDA1 family)
VSLRALARHAGEAWEVPRDLMLGRYPPFVTGGPLPRSHVPVFVFHSVEPESFGRRLDYLADNGYVTLSAEEYFQFLLGGRAAPERAVVLTFDDGRGSLWSVAAPLLERRRMKGIVFLVPGRTPSRPEEEPLPTWADAREGRAAAADVLSREEREPLLSWEEIRTLAARGVFDFQSHTLTHARIHTDARVVGFVTPALRRGYDAFDLPLVASADGRDLPADEVPLGRPILQWAPRTSEALRFREEPGFGRACIEAVAAGGGERFFERPRWQRELRALVGAPPAGTHETIAQRDEAILRELVESRSAIEERTGRPVIHLCFPWHASGPTARRLAREAGYRTAFCGKVRGTTVTLAGGDLASIARIGEDYVELLPGRGRTTLTAVLQEKWRRRRRAAS